jgi:hypothetical protein
MPARCRFSDVSTVTGEGVSVSVRRNSEPVTTISSTSGLFGRRGWAAVWATAWLAPRKATAAPQIIVDAMRRARMGLVCKVVSPMCGALFGCALMASDSGFLNAVVEWLPTRRTFSQHSLH